jgi:hypothetical protein
VDFVLRTRTSLALVDHRCGSVALSAIIPVKCGELGVNLEPLKRTFAMFGVVIGALYIFTVLYSLFQHGIFSPFDLAVAAVVMYAVFVLDRRYIRPFFYPSFAREGEGRSEDPEDESSETLRERGSQTERSER